MTRDLPLLDAATLTGLYRRRELSPVEVVRATLERIAARDPALNSYCLVDAEAALAAARASEERWRRGTPAGPVDGVPAAIKDLATTAGWPTLRGTFTGPPPSATDADAPPVARLRAQGAILLGKTTLPELAWKGVTDSPRFGITRNPWDLSRTPGGSSGGSAAAVAAGLAVLGHGTDGSGSVRIPAAFCGLFGHKPTYGVVAQVPVPAQLNDIVHTGPLTRTVRDGALMLQVMAGPDPRDFSALPGPHDFLSGLEDGIRGLRIAYSHDLGHATVDPEVGRLCRAALAAFTELGARVEEADPGFADPRDLIDMFYRAGLARVVFQIPEADRARMDPGLVAFAAEGLAATAADYVGALMRRAALAAQVAAFHQRFDLLVTPQVGIAAFAAGHNVPEGSGMRHWFDWAPFTYPFNLTQQPAATVPCGVTQDGLPVALQIVGPKYADALVLRAARAFETARPFARAPETSSPA